jgi:general secretion pathway protein H
VIRDSQKRIRPVALEAARSFALAWLGRTDAAVAIRVTEPTLSRITNHGSYESRITNHCSRGFSLIELLVVVVILSVVIGAVLLRIGAGPERELQRDAERLAALIQLGCERAERVGRDLGLSVDGQGYRFGWILPQGFVPMDSGSGDALRERSWERPLSLRMERDGRVQALAESNRAPQIGCSARGELTAFRIELRAPDGDEAWQVAGGTGRRVEASRVGG